MTTFKKLFDESQAAFREQPETAAVVFSTESRLIDGFKSSVEARQFRFFADEPEALGGKDTAQKFLVGQVMRITRGTANPSVVADMVARELEAKRP